MICQGKLELTANLVRQAAVQAGGLVAVSRDPVRASYLRENAAPGATTQAMSAVLGGAGFVARELRAAEPLIQLGFLRHLDYVAATLGMFLHMKKLIVPARSGWSMHAPE